MHYPQPTHGMLKPCESRGPSALVWAILASLPARTGGSSGDLGLIFVGIRCPHVLLTIGGRWLSSKAPGIELIYF